MFKCETPVVHLNNVLEELILTPYCPFQLGGKVFDLFTEIFLFYDYSVKNFVQNIKVCIILVLVHFIYNFSIHLT